MSDTLFINGRIFGGRRLEPPTWFDWIMIRDGVIADLGHSDDKHPSSKGLREVNLRGAYLFPGFFDAHLHLAWGGQYLLSPDLSGLAPQAIPAKLSFFLSNGLKLNTHWLDAFNYESHRGALTAADLDRAIPDIPLMVHTRDLHSACCNSAALRLGGITRNTPNPPNGIIERSPDGEPTGVLREAALGLVARHRPELTPADRRTCILSAQKHLVSLGLTAASEILNNGDEDIYRELDRSGELKLRIDGWRRLAEGDPGGIPAPRSRFKVDTVKAYLDGAFGSHTAALLADYADQPGNRGVMMFRDAELFEQLAPIAAKGWRVALHALGDAAVTQALSILHQIKTQDSGVAGAESYPTGSAGTESYPTKKRHRVEHLQMLPQDGVDLVRRAGVTASLQPVHLLSDSLWLRERLGDDGARRSFIWKSLWDAGVPLALGTDWPVMPADPLLNLHTAINRCGFGDSDPLDDGSIEALEPWQAVRAVTYGSAAAAGLENSCGTLIPGMSADFTVVGGLSPDLRDWSNAKVVFTVCSGEIVYDAS